MRAIILISALFITSALYAQKGAKESSKENTRYMGAVFWIGIIYAVVLDLTE